MPIAPDVNLTINDVQSATIRPNVRTTTILNYKFCEISVSLNLYACLIMIYNSFKSQFLGTMMPNEVISTWFVPFLGHYGNI